LRPPFFAARFDAPFLELFLPADFLPPFFLLAMVQGLQYWNETLNRSPGGSVSLALAHHDALAQHGLRGGS
jgi:hypothetical protein